MVELVNICVNKEIVDKVNIIKGKTGLSEGCILDMILDKFIEEEIN